MEEYRSKNYCAKWEKLHGADGAPKPGPRGGHTMCIDEGAGNNCFDEGAGNRCCDEGAGTIVVLMKPEGAINSCFGEGADY